MLLRCQRFILPLLLLVLLAFSGNVTSFSILYGLHVFRPSLRLPFSVVTTPSKLLMKSSASYSTPVYPSPSSSSSNRGNGSGDGDGMVVQLNHAGASPSPPCVIERMVKHLELEQQVGGYQAASMVKEELANVYQHIGRLINAPSPSTEIALVESATVGWTRLFYAMVQYQNRKHLTTPVRTNNTNSDDDRKKVILVSQIEYATNVVACCHWVQQQEQEQQSQLHNNNGSQWTVLAIPSVLVEDEPSSNDDDDNNNNNHQNTGVVDVKALEDMLQGRFVVQKDGPGGALTTLDPSTIAMVCLTHIPTNSGVINPVDEIGAVIAKYNNDQQQKLQTRTAITSTTSSSSSSSSFPQILYLVDACQSIGQRPVNVVHMHCHGLAATGRKYLRGPRGTGFLYVSQDIVNELVPHQVDHASAPITKMMTHNNERDMQNTLPAAAAANATRTDDNPSFNRRHHHNYYPPLIPVEQMVDFSYQPGAARFEFWESNIANRLGLGRAVQYALDEVGIESIAHTIHDLATTLHQKLHQLHPRLKVHHPKRLNNNNDNEDDDETLCCGIVTFWIKEMSAHAVQQALLLQCSPVFVVSVSPPTSTPLDSACLQVPDLVRASLSYTNTMEELEQFCQQLLLIILTEEKPGD